jgi:hypothetical protein
MKKNGKEYVFVEGYYFWLGKDGEPSQRHNANVGDVLLDEGKPRKRD